eukprot:gene10445-biopygen4052
MGYPRSVKVADLHTAEQYLLRDSRVGVPLYDLLRSSLQILLRNNGSTRAFRVSALNAVATIPCGDEEGTQWRTAGGVPSV